MDHELFQDLLTDAVAVAKDPGFIFDPAFPLQRAFVDDPAKLKCLFCTRRSSKSYTAGLYAFYEALRYPHSNILLVGLTRLSSKGIFWKDILKNIDQKYGLGSTFNLTELNVTLPNGSMIQVAGIDADEDE